MRCYRGLASNLGAADLWIRPPDMQVASRMLTLASTMGYRLLGIETSNLEWEEASAECKKHGIRCVKRITIKSSSISKVKKVLRNSRMYPDIIAIVPETLNVARFAARDGRIKIIVATTPRFLDRSERRLLSVGGGAVELCLSEILEGRGIGKIVASMRRAAANGIKIILSSCASIEWGLGPPMSAASLPSLAGLPQRIGYDAIYVNPYGLV